MICYLYRYIRLKVFFLYYRGWKIALSSLPAMQNPSRIDLSSFFARMVRYVGDAFRDVSLRSLK